ncbi:helix-turn-helix domain-containing protein [Enterococcus sp. LJL51]|uniref:helix-turn-helix domain-containing protein n=1 Tax=Enterococcus sp. LJL51 TaxID=3416656 RepID=UPI003CEC1780
MREGELFRQLRKDRGLSLKKVADELNSVSFISKFEQGNSNISIHRLERLLENINVTIEEFYYLRAPKSQVKLFTLLTDLPHYMTGTYLVYLNRIMIINEKYNLYQREKGIAELRKIYSELDGSIRWQNFVQLFCQILIDSYQANLHKVKGVGAQKLFDNFRIKTRPVVSYLYSVENWGVFEVLIFRFFQFAFPVETIRQLLPTALSRMEKEAGLSMMRDLRTSLLFSVFTTFINFRYIDECKEVLKILEKILSDTSDSANSIHLLFYKGWFQMVTESKEKGLEKCQQAISIFRILNLPKLVQNSEYILEIVLQNLEKPDDYMVFS